MTRVIYLLPLALALVAGSVDTAGYLLLAHVFTSHMSGNTVVSTMQVGAGNWREAWRHFEPIVAFFAGVAIGFVLNDLLAARRVSRTFSALALVEIGLLLAFIALAHPAREWMVAFPAAAMGMQNALIRRVGEERVRTTYVTGMLTNTAQRLIEFVISTFTHDRKTREKLNEFALYGGIWCCFAGGGIAGAFLELHYGPNALLLPICGLAALAFSDALHPLACVQQQK